MIKLCVFYSAIIIVIFDSTFADRDLTLIFQSKQNNSYDVSCVIGENTLTTAPIYWTDDAEIPLLSPSSSRYVPNHFQINFAENKSNDDWISNDTKWNIGGGSNMKPFGPVLDERWEMFQTEELINETKNVWSGQNFESILVSVFISKMDYIIYIGDKYYVDINSHSSSVAEKGTSNQKCNTTFEKSYKVWLHFAITKIKDENKMTVTFFPNQEQLEWNIYKNEVPNFVNISRGVPQMNNKKSGFWKLHKYNYLYSEERYTDLHEIGRAISHTGELCIAIYAAVCNNCSLKMTLKDDNGVFKKNFEIKAERNQGTHYLWNKMVIKEKTMVKNKIQFFVQKNNTQGNNGFWAIGSIRLCELSEVRVASINRPSKHNTNCRSLADTKSSVSGSGANLTNLTCQAGQLGESCNISCKSIFQKDDYCGNTICSSKGCSCSWGLHGENCNKECGDSFWGENCKNKCGHCKNKKVCNRFNGTCSNGCEGSYTGNKCAERLPILKDMPVADNISHTSIKISIKKNYKGNYLPTRIHIEYRKQNEKWKSFCVVEYNNFKICDITELTPATKYDIRAVLVAEEGKEEDDIPILTVTTTCKDINEDIIRVDPDKYDANVTVKFEDPTLCNLDLYTVKLRPEMDSPRNLTDPFVNGKISIPNLNSYTVYTIVFFNNLNNSTITKSFRTKPTKPGRVINLKSKSFSESISLDWNAPKTNGEKINYTVRYKLVGHIACKSNFTGTGNLSPSIHESEINRTVLPNLTAYSYYEISVQATNEAGNGEIENTTAATEKSDDLTDEMINTNVTVTVGEIQIIPPRCETVKGPLYYTVKYIYNDSQSCISIDNAKIFSIDKIESNYGVKKLNDSQNLIPYSNYLVTILAKRSENKYVKYQRKYKSKPSIPVKVRNLIVYSKNESHVWLRWIAPCPTYGQLEKYIVSVTNNTEKKTHFTSDMIQTTCVWEHKECVVIKNLRPNQFYNFEVQAKNKDVASYGEANTIQHVGTCEEESEAPEKLTHRFEAEELSLNWMHPNVTNGPLRQFNIYGYIIESELKNSAQNISENYIIQMDQLDYNKKLNATPATVFNISVMATNSKTGKPASIRVATPPPKPKLSCPPFITSCSEGTCSINIPSASSSTCINCHFYLVVTLKPNEKNSSPFRIFPFYEKIRNNEENTEILQSEHWIAKNDSFGNTVRNISIGRAVNDRPVYNSSDYLIHMILVSSYKEQFSTKTYRLDYGIEEGEINGLYYLLLLLVIFLAVLSFFIYRFWRKNKVESKKEKESTNVNSPLKKNAERISEDTYPLMNLPPLAPKPNILKETKNKYSKVIELSNLKSYLKEAAEGDTNHSQLSKQHEMCKSGYNKPIEIGSMEINKKKNRYKDLIAYDHTRVKLKCTDENGSDYINANYIDGYMTKKAYIATQGPKANTVNDFWHMIWEQNVGNIVMLANVIENGKKKCEEYWPALNRTMKFQDISVQNIKTNVFSSYIYREFQVTCKGNKRIINHLHFTLWPDHGVPLYPQNLVPFMREMLKIPQGKHPIVVHCSAGIGRTGTVLLCDIVLRMAALEKKVDFLKIYHRLREQRPNMVDNPAQYILAHLVVYECLFGKDFSIPLDRNFKARIEELFIENKIKSIMDYLEEVNWQIKIMQGCFHNELSDVNKEKNRFQTILPGCSQVYLERYPEDDENSDYINAVGMDCFQYQDRFIVTQQPLPNTVGDFWRLILQYDVNTIVSLNEIQRKDNTSCIFWPTRNESFYPVDYIEVSYQNEEDRGDFSIIKIAITNENENQRKHISLICLHGWMPEKSTPADPTGILAVRDYMFNTTFGHDNLIVVTCYDGAKASGLYVALSFLIEKIKLEHSCDVALAVSTVRQRRMQCVRNKEQFKFLLNAASLYVESFETYANFDNL